MGTGRGTWVFWALWALGCAQSPAPGAVDSTRVVVRTKEGADGGLGEGDGGRKLRCLPFGGPDCCGAHGGRVGSASCSADGYACAEGALCTCQGQVAEFFCVDVCGGDAFVSPACTSEGWRCPSGLLSTSDCPAGTCFGEPGECCLSPRCLDGQWSCEALAPNCR